MKVSKVGTLPAAEAVKTTAEAVNATLEQAAGANKTGRAKGTKAPQGKDIKAQKDKMVVAPPKSSKVEASVTLKAENPSQAAVAEVGQTSPALRPPSPAPVQPNLEAQQLEAQVRQTMTAKENPSQAAVAEVGQTSPALRPPSPAPVQPNLEAQQLEAQVRQTMTAKELDSAPPSSPPSDAPSSTSSSAVPPQGPAAPPVTVKTPHQKAVEDATAILSEADTPELINELLKWQDAVSQTIVEQARLKLAGLKSMDSRANSLHRAAQALVDRFSQLNGRMDLHGRAVNGYAYSVNAKDVAKLTEFESALADLRTETRPVAASLKGACAEFSNAIQEQSHKAASERSLEDVARKVMINVPHYHKGEVMWQKMVEVWGNHHTTLESDGQALKEALATAENHLSVLHKKIDPTRQKLKPQPAGATEEPQSVVTNLYNYFWAPAPAKTESKQ